MGKPFRPMSMVPRKKALPTLLLTEPAAFRLLPNLQDFRFYHTHVRAKADLSVGQYSGLVGPLYIEPKNNPGDYDREVFLTLKEFEPTFSRGGDMAMDFLSPATVVKNLKDTGESAMQASLAKGASMGTKLGTVLSPSTGGCWAMASRYG